MKKNYQIIVEAGAVPESHEIRTAQVLIKYGDVKFIKPSRIKNERTPDVEWLGLKWEIKAPKSGDWDGIHNIMRKAAKQSENVIIDLRRLKCRESNPLKATIKIATTFRKIKKLKVITKNGEMLDIKK